MMSISVFSGSSIPTCMYSIVFAIQFPKIEKAKYPLNVICRFIMKSKDCAGKLRRIITSLRRNVILKLHNQYKRKQELFSLMPALLHIMKTYHAEDNE